MARRAAMSQGAVLDLAHRYFPSFLRSRERALRADSWLQDGGPEDEGLFVPAEHHNSAEYRDLQDRSPTPWASLIVTAVAQTMFVDGVRSKGVGSDLQVWETWRRNKWDSHQASLYRDALHHGYAFGTALPGKDPLTGELMPVLRGVSARRMAAFYEDDGHAEWPMFAISGWEQERRGDNGDTEKTWLVQLLDDVAAYWLSCRGDGVDRKDWTYISHEDHTLPVTPVVRYTNLINLDGQTMGETEPLIPLFRRIDQDTFDRLIVQRFGAWKVRYATGISRPKDTAEEERILARLQVDTIMLSTDAQSKFGTLDASDLKGFIDARDADLRDLSAVSQTPPHHLMGLSSNLQAEALAAAEAGLQRKSVERKTSFGESHEQLLRLAAFLRRNSREAKAWDMQVQWRDTESRSLEQAARALGTLATQVNVPSQILWERIPGWSDTDTARALELVESGAMDQLAQQVLGQLGGQGEDQSTDGDND